MENKFTILSELSLITIKNYSDELIVTLLPLLGNILDVAETHTPQNTLTSVAMGVASKIEESASVVTLSRPKLDGKISGRTLSVKEKPVEIVIEQPLDENSLVNCLRLLGEHTPASMSQQEVGSLFALLEKNQLIDQLKYQRTGIRIVFRILEQTFRPLYRLPPMFDNFTGRDQELAQLQAQRDAVQVIVPDDNAIGQGDQDKIISQVSGTGGIGKSQLANYYARLQFREKNYQWVVWIAGGEDDLRTQNNLLSQFAELGLALGLDIKQLKDEVLYQLIYERLAAKGRGLVVVDDVPNYAVVKPFLPECFGQREIDVLITTRNSRTFGPAITKIILDVFTMEDAKRYIRRILKDTITDAESKLLATTLDRYPLAITQALAYVLNNQCTISEYCQRYETVHAARKKYLETPVHEDDPYQLQHQRGKRKFEATMQAVVQLSLEQVKALCKSEDAFERAKTILFATAYLAPEMAIPKALLARWLRKDEGDIQINDVLESLRALSLLEEESQPATYRIHQVVQDTLRLEETPDNTQMRLLKWSEIVEGYLDSSDLSFRAYDEKKYCALEPHMIALAQLLNLQARKDEFLEAEVSLLMAIGNACVFQGKVKNSKSCFVKALEACTLMSLSNNKLSGMSLGMSNYATTISCSGDHQNAKKIFEDLLPVYRDYFDEKHMFVGGCQMNLGWATHHCGDSQSARAHFEAALPILEATLGENHVDVGLCLTGLGMTILFCGDPEDAKSRIEKAVSILEGALEYNHPHMGIAYMCLGKATLSCGDPQPAEDLLKIAVSILEDNFGKEHADVGLCRMDLGNATFSSGNPEEAKEHFKTALQTLNRALGKNNVESGRCMANLGRVAFECGEVRNAQAHLKKALKILRISLDDKNEDVRKCAAFLKRAMQASVEAAAVSSDRKANSPVFRKAHDAAREMRRAAGEGSTDDLQLQLDNHLTFANQPDQKPGSGRTPLHWAVINKRPEHVGLLLAYIGYTTVKDSQGCCALEYAVQDGNAVIIDHFKTALMNDYSVHQDTQLPILVRRCVEAGDESGLKLLLHLKVPVDHADADTGQTALHLAVIKGDENLIKLLLEAGADPFREDFKGNTALSLAQEKDELLVITILQNFTLKIR